MSIDFRDAQYPGDDIEYTNREIPKYVPMPRTDASHADDFRKDVASHGGEPVSSQYIGDTFPYEIRDRNGHTLYRSTQNLKRHGLPCYRCQVLEEME